MGTSMVVWERPWSGVAVWRRLTAPVGRRLLSGALKERKGIALVEEGNKCLSAVALEAARGMDRRSEKLAPKR